MRHTASREVRARQPPQQWHDPCSSWRVLLRSNVPQRPGWQPLPSHPVRCAGPGVSSFARSARSRQRLVLRSPAARALRALASRAMPRARREDELPPLLPAVRSGVRRAGYARAARDAADRARARRHRVGFRRGARAAPRRRGSLRVRASPIETHARTTDLGPRIELRRDGDQGEAHRLDVTPERAVLAGTGPAGLRYAVETLAQLVDARGRVPACHIEDAPDFPKRGIMLDVSRGKVPTPRDAARARRSVRAPQAQRPDAVRRAHLRASAATRRSAPAPRRSPRRRCASSTPTRPRASSI